MSKCLSIEFDSGTLDSVCADFDLRAPNREALRKLIFTLEGDYDPDVMQVMNLATGVGKTYLMAAFVEYLRLQGVGNVMIVTPGKTVQAKTVQNFSHGTPRYIAGSPCPPEVVTPQDYSAWVARSNGPAALTGGRDTPVLAFVFNIQQLIAPRSLEGETHGSGQNAVRRRPRRFDESAGVLFDYLKGLDDLVVIADESHLYSESAAAFHSALRELDPAATIGLTASAAPGDHVIFRYPLYRAISDRYVKAPVLAFRKEGYGDDAASEEQQLADALQLREIKQRWYDAYAERNGLPHLNAVVFVVCADTDHATQVTDLLRSPRYLGRPLAVLQVDSNHDDEVTQRLLERLDAPDSPVLAVVSVNMLKEGWDVKNIAVVVALRAMASDVLTQQTMGRGLRLPFGRYTDVLQIDQLDIIAHQSFRDLMEAENVLRQFGLEDAVSEDAAAHVREALGSAAAGGAAAPLPRAEQGGPAQRDSGCPAGGAAQQSIEYRCGPEPAAPSLGFSEIGSGGLPMGTEKPPQLASVTIPRNPRFADVSYSFPSTTVTTRQPEMNVSEISPDEIKRAAERVTSTGDILVRKEIVAAVGGGLSARDTESAEVDSVHIEADDARRALVRLVLDGGLIKTTRENAGLISKYLVKSFMDAVPFEQWTVKSLASATEELRALVKSYADSVLRASTEHTEIVPRRMPGADALLVPFGESVHDPIDRREDFVRGRFYSGWSKSLFEAESFDSYTGEYLLAKLLNTSPHIVWWQRFHPNEGASIYYTPKDRYFPDFLACDDEGVYWIVEGKNQGGRSDASVQAKRRAAESVVIRLLATEGFEDHAWGYLIAYEDDIARSDSWDELKGRSDPICNA